MGSMCDGQTGREKPGLILHGGLGIVEPSSATQESFKLSFTYQLSVCFLHKVHCIFGEWGLSLFSFNAQHCSSRCKAGSCNHTFP